MHIRAVASRRNPSFARKLEDGIKPPHEDVAATHHGGADKYQAGVRVGLLPNQLLCKLLLHVSPVSHISSY